MYLNLAFKDLFSLSRASFHEDGKVKHRTHGRLTGMNHEQLKLVQAALCGDVIP